MPLLAPARPLAGPLRFIRYGFMPNRLRYCGPDENPVLFDYAIENVVDPGLDPLLRQFTGALPYLKLISRANLIPDPFNERVVEAYWIGNELLECVEMRQLYDTILARASQHLSGKALEWVLSKAPAGARPHHNFHVFDVHSRVGDSGQSMVTMDQCRISWGKVTAVENSELVVERQPLRLLAGKLELGEPETERVVRQVDGHGFADNAQPGDWVSLHWSWVCEVLSDEQQRRLERYTRYHLGLANQTL